jgi:hypothetical protein
MRLNDRRVMAIVKMTKERRFWKTEEKDFPARPV